VFVCAITYACVYTHAMESNKSSRLFVFTRTFCFLCMYVCACVCVRTCFRMCVCVRESQCVCSCMCVCVRTGVCVCVQMCVCVFAKKNATYKKHNVFLSFENMFDLSYVAYFFESCNACRRERVCACACVCACVCVCV